MQISFLSFLSLLLFFLSITTAMPNPEAKSISSPALKIATFPKLHPLEKRDCWSNGCGCAVDAEPGLYCGTCMEIEMPYNDNSIFQCGQDGECCEYGYRKECDKGGRRCPFSLKESRQMALLTDDVGIM